MKRIWIALLCMLALAWTAPVAAEEAHSAAGKGSDKSAQEIVNKGIPEAQVSACKTCHGKKGESRGPIFPHLAGQYRDYMVQALKDYRSGDRSNAIMNRQVAALSDAQIEALAGYYASQKVLLATLPR